MEKNFELGQKFFFFIYEPFIWANTSFSEIQSINCVRDDFMCLSLSRIEFSLVSD